MALGIGDSLLSLFGQPGPREQLVRQAFGGQTATPAGGAAPAQGAGQAGAPAQPDAVQSPQEIADLMMQFMKRQETARGIDQGLGLIAAELRAPGEPGEHPRRNRRRGGAGAGGGDAFGGAMGMIGDVMKVQQAQAAFQQQQRDRAALVAAIPMVAQAYNIPKEALETMMLTDPKRLADMVASIGGNTTLGANDRLVRGNEVVVGQNFAPQAVSAGSALANPNTGQVIYQQPAEGTTAERNVRAMGLDPMTPEGQAAMRQFAAPSSVTVNNAGENAFNKKLGEGAGQQFLSLSDNGVAARRNMASIDQLQAVLEKAPSGMEAAIKSTLGEWGIQTEGLDKVQAATALVNQLVPAQRPAGSGTMSDRDVELFKSSLPRLINSPNGNAIILQTMRGMQEYDMALSDIADRVINGELDQREARKLMREVKNPIDDLRAKLKDMPAGGGRDAAASGAPAPAAPAGGAPVSVKTIDEARQLPPGTQFTDPNGVVRIVPPRQSSTGGSF